MATKGAHAWVCAPVLLGFLLNCATVVDSREVVLLDTRDKDYLGWATYTSPKDPVELPDGSETTNTGWTEASYGKDSPQRIFASCNVRIPNVNNWVRTPFIDRSDAISVSIEIRFTMRKCSRLTDASSLQQCKETFNLFYFEANDDFANDKFPTWDPETYTLRDKVAADYMWEKTTDDNVIINVERRDVKLNPNIRGVYFAFQDEGSCVSLMSVRVFYITCPPLTVNFAFFKEVPAGSTQGQVEEYNGVCVANSVQKTPPTHLCQSSGEWYREPKGECVCMPGHEGNPERTKCSPCKVNFYKWSEGVGPCQECPLQSHSTSPGSSQCTCQAGFYRAVLDSKSRPCTRPPSAPQNLIVAEASSSSVTLNWAPPSDLGGRADLEYRVVCAECGTQVLYRPGWHGFNTTSVTLTNLLPSTSYRITVYAENGVSNISGSVASVFINSRTEPSATTPTATTGAPRAEHHDVLCGPTSMSFKIPVPALVADNQTLAQTMTLSDPRCRVDVVSSRLTGSTSLNDCGTTLEVTNDSLVFSNAILLPAANDSGVTSLIPIQCRYDRLANLTVSAYLPVVRQVLFTETGVGQLSFRINQYRDATFSSRVADSAYPLRLHSSDDVFVELALGGDQQLEGLGMDVLGCMALPSSSPAAADAVGVYENLIENNCPASPEVRLLNDRLPAASQNHSLFRFSFKALTFPDPADPQRSRTGVVYIHCRVKLCKSSECRSGGQCPSSSALSRSKRAVGGLAEGSAGHQLSTGPLLVDGDSSESNASSPLVVFLGVVAACATLVAMVATVAWRRSRRRGDLQRLDKVTADLQ